MWTLWLVGAMVVAVSVTWAIWRSGSESCDDPKAPVDVVLRDGREYAVEFDDARIWVSKRSGEVANELPWADLSAVYVLAIDRFPIGSISWMLHGADKQIVEVPIDAEGATDLFKAMQVRLQGFDNRAAIESVGMLHGFRKLWPRSMPR